MIAWERSERAPLDLPNRARNRQGDGGSTESRRSQPRCAGEDRVFRSDFSFCELLGSESLLLEVWLSNYLRSVNYLFCCYLQTPIAAIEISSERKVAEVDWFAEGRNVLRRVSTMACDNHNRNRGQLRMV